MTETGKGVSGILSQMTIEDVKRLAPEVVVLPIGSTEPHGPHLPYGTDAFQVEAVATGAVTQANASGARVLLYPTLPISNNVNFQAYPFACRVSVRTLMLMLLDIIEALEQDGMRKVVLLNGHGGNCDTIRATIREHVGRRRPGQGAFVCSVDDWALAGKVEKALIDHPSQHAGQGETSRMMYLHPDLVRPEHFQDFEQKTPVIDALADGKVYCVRPWHAYLPASAGGETRTSSAAKGKALIEESVSTLAKFLVDLSHAPMHDLFPFPPAAE